MADYHPHDIPNDYNLPTQIDVQLQGLVNSVADVVREHQKTLDERVERKQLSVNAEDVGLLSWRYEDIAGQLKSVSQAIATNVMGHTKNISVADEVFRREFQKKLNAAFSDKKLREAWTRIRQDEYGLNDLVRQQIEMAISINAVAAGDFSVMRGVFLSTELPIRYIGMLVNIITMESQSQNDPDLPFKYTSFKEGYKTLALNESQEADFKNALKDRFVSALKVNPVLALQWSAVGARVNKQLAEIGLSLDVGPFTGRTGGGSTGQKSSGFSSF